MLKLWRENMAFVDNLVLNPNLVKQHQSIVGMLNRTLYK